MDDTSESPELDKQQKNNELQSSIVIGLFMFTFVFVCISIAGIGVYDLLLPFNNQITSFFSTGRILFIVLIASSVGFRFCFKKWKDEMLCKHELVALQRLDEEDIELGFVWPVLTILAFITSFSLITFFGDKIYVANVDIIKSAVWFLKELYTNDFSRAVCIVLVIIFIVRKVTNRLQKSQIDSIDSILYKPVIKGSNISIPSSPEAREFILASKDPDRWN